MTPKADGDNPSPSVSLNKIKAGVLILSYLALLLLVPSSNVNAASPLVFEPGISSYSVGRHLDFLEDPSGTLNFKQISSPEFSGGYRPATGNIPNFGFTSSAYWARLVLQGDMGKTDPWLLEIAYPLLDSIRIFTPQPDGSYQEKQAGDLLPFTAREIKNRNFLFELPPHLSGAGPIYLRFQSASTMNFPLTIWSKSAFVRMDHDTQISLGLYYGFILVMILYSALMLLSLRDANYFYYLIFIVSFGSYQIIMNGSAYEYLWPNQVWWNNYSMPIAVAFSAMGVGLFTRSFLSLAIYSPVLDKVVIILAGLCFASVGTALAGYYALAIKSSALLAIIIMVASVISGVICLRKQYRPARWFMIAWSMFFLGVVLNSLRAFGILPANFLTLSGPQYGSAMTVILLALALADRFNLMKTEAEKAQLQYRKIFENAKEGIFRSAIDGSLVMANPALAMIFGFDSPEHMIASSPNLENIYSQPEQRQEFTRQILAKGSISGFETRMLRRDGIFIPVEITAHLVTNEKGEPLYLEGILSDITARKKAEELRMARDTAEAANQAKSEFLANMSHEIRTPMNGIIGMTGLLLDSQLTPPQRDYAETIRTSAESLLTIINDILDFSKIEAGKLDLEKFDFDLRLTLEDVHDLLIFRARQKNIKFTITTDPNIPSLLVGDPGRLRQIIINLADNAIKFTDHGEVGVDVRLQSADDSGVALLFTVSDTGIGVPAGLSSKLFEPFSQVDTSSTRKVGGTGLGLSISKRLAEGMGGQIGLESNTGKGARFWFTVKLGRQDCLRTLSNGRRKTPSAGDIFNRHSLGASRRCKTRILLVEDNPINQKVSIAILTRLGCQTQLAANGREALKVLLDNTFDLILMDCEMPEMDGYEATRQIRRREDALGNHGKRAVIVAMTAHAMAGSREKCLAAGMDDFVSKPVAPEKLAEILQKWLDGGEHSGPTEPLALCDPIAPEILTAAGCEPDLPKIALVLLERLNGDRALTQRIITIFLDDTPLKLGQLKEALRARQADQARSLAHALHGSCAVLGAQSLQEVMREVEQCCRQNEFSAAQDKLVQLEELYQRLADELRFTLAALSQGSGSKPCGE